VGVEVCLNPALGCLEYRLTLLTQAAKAAPAGVELERRRRRRGRRRGTRQGGRCSLVY